MPTTARFAGVLRSAGSFAGFLIAVAVVTTWLAELTTGSTPVPGLPAPSVAVTYAIPVVRVLLDVSVLATMGLALLAKFLGFDDPDHTEPVMRGVRRWAVRASWAWIVTALTSVVFLSAEVFPDRFPSRTSGVVDVVTLPLSFLQYVVTSPDLIWDYITGVPAGKGLLVVTGIGVLSVLVCRSRCAAESPSRPSFVPGSPPSDCCRCRSPATRATGATTTW